MDQEAQAQLRADDQIVTVDRDRHGIQLAGQPSLRDAIEYKVPFSDIVVTLDVDEIGGVLAAEVRRAMAIR